MNLVRFDPFRAFHEMQREMNRLFGEYTSPRGEEATTAWTWTPAVDVIERGDDVVLSVDLPGVDPKDVQVQLEGNTLTIRGERKLDEKGVNVYARERAHGPFFRSFTVPGVVDREKIRADFTHGVLMVTLPRSAEAKPRRIPLQLAA